MNSRSKKADRNLRVLRLWTFEQATKALPYISSLARSLREKWLEANRARAHAEKLAAASGRPKRDAILAQNLANKEKDLAEEDLFSVIQELESIDAYCLDPVNGLILMPFRQEEELAWFVFDLFKPGEPLQWRFHKDDLGLRRPITPEIQNPPPTPEKPMPEKPTPEKAE